MNILEDQISMIELQSIIVDYIEHDIPYMALNDKYEREVILKLPSPQEAGTEYQKHTYANVCAEQLCENLRTLEDMDDTYVIDHFKDS